MTFSDTDDANPPELPERNGWHVVVNGKCVYCGLEFDTQMVADSPNSPNCEDNVPGGVIEFAPGEVWMDPETGEFGRYSDD